MTWFITIAAVASGAAAVAAGAGATAGRRVSMLTVLIGLATLAVATFAVLVLGIARDLGLFGIAHVLYLQAAVAAPIVGVGLLALGRRRSTSVAAAVACVVLLVPAPIGLWATHVAPFRLQLDEHRVPATAVDEGQGTVRIAVMADLQTAGVGGHERRAVQELLDTEPDVILLPGDLFQGDTGTLATEGPAVRDLLARLDAPGGVYLVEGDVDSTVRLDAVVPPNITRLDDQIVELQIRDRRVLIGGTRLDVTAPTADRVRDDLANDDGALTVLVSHRPDTVLHLPVDSGVDLVVAGHTHGGQIALPWWGPPVTLSKVPRAVGAGGLHEVAGNPVYVSTGVGMERGQAPQIRLGVPPSIGILDLG